MAEYKALFEQIELYFAQTIDNSTNTKPHVLLGLSGGPDSVFLLHFLLWLRKQNKIELSAAHLDHGWRNESQEEANFCSKITQEHGVSLFLGHAKQFQGKFKYDGSKEDVARKMRRSFFEQTKTECQANVIALAHHAQDQEETFFIRLLRGSTLDGLTCMKPLENTYVRPLLNTSRKQIIDYLKTNRITFKIDPSNTSDKFLRNRIRNHVIPALNQIDTRFSQKFKDTLKALQEENAFLKSLTSMHFNHIFVIENQKAVAKRADFFALPVTIQKRLLIFWLKQENVSFSPSLSFLHEILRFLSLSSGGSHWMSESWKIVKNKGNFWIEKT